VVFVFYVMDIIALNMPMDRGASVFFILIIIAVVAYLFGKASRSIVLGVIFGAVGAIGLGIVYYVAGNVTENLYIFDGVIFKTLRWFSLLSRFNMFNLGILSVTNIVYYITFSAAFVYLTVSAIEKRRWR
jgi:ABC-2 type transport system permease protein